MDVDFTFEVPSPSGQVALTPQPSELPCAIEGNPFACLGHPAGGCFGRAEDILRLLNLHLNDGVWKGKRLIEKAELAEMHRVQYATEIEVALAEGRAQMHEFWALGWLTRGTTTSGWFGFGDTVSPRAFGHAGINTVIGVADPETDLALVFLTTNSPKSDPETVRLRDTVTNLVAKAVV